MFGNLAVNSDIEYGLVIAANPAKRCGFQILLDRMVAFVGQYGIEMLKRLR